MKVRITNKALEKMQEHAEKTFPNECCGFMFGEDGSERIIVSIMSTKNTRHGDQRRRFEISALDYINAEKYALENNIVLLGVYHSHPNHPAKPSKYDLNQAVPYFSYVIISVMDGKEEKTTSWRLNKNEEFEEEYITLVNNHSTLKLN